VINTIEVATEQKRVGKNVKMKVSFVREGGKKAGQRTAKRASGERKTVTRQKRSYKTRRKMLSWE